MEKLTVSTTTTTHIDDKGVRRIVGETYETAKNYAELRKGSGLVDFDGEGKAVAGEPLLHTGVTGDSGLTTTAIVEQGEGNQGALVTVSKKALAAAKKAAKKEAKEKAEGAILPAPEKVEGVFPGGPVIVGEVAPEVITDPQPEA
jgi:hypothetical protein